MQTLCTNNYFELIFSVIIGHCTFPFSQQKKIIIIIPLDNYKVLVYSNVKYALLLFLIFMENQEIVKFLSPGKVVEMYTIYKSWINHGIYFIVNVFVFIMHCPKIFNQCYIVLK